LKKGFGRPIALSKQFKPVSSSGVGLKDQTPVGVISKERATDTRTWCGFFLCQKKTPLSGVGKIDKVVAVFSK